jgi:hypothetical protein
MSSSALPLFHPSTWKPAFSAARSLWFDYAHVKSVLTGSCIDAQQQPIPWYTYPAIEYLKQLDFGNSAVFEYGSGHSTLFWAARARRVVSVEDDEVWYRRISGSLPDNCELILQPDLRAYAETIKQYYGGFDVVVVDGAARGGTRLRCSRAALTRLRAGGLIILDNSDWLPESARLLRDADLIQVDMTGFVPIGAHTQTTSFFFHREFRRQPRGNRQPLPGPGAAHKVWEHPRPVEPPVVDVADETFGGVRRDEPFAFATPRGPRRFRLIVGRVTPDGPGQAAIVDVDRQRVLLSITEQGADARRVEAEVGQALGMPWEAFVRFVNAHDKKRYALS